MRTAAFWVLAWPALAGAVIAGQNPASRQAAAKPGTEQPSAGATTDRDKPTSALPAALALYRTGKFAAAESAYNEILKSDPNSASVLVGLTRVHIKQGRLTEAAASIGKALALNPASEEVQTAQGELYFREARLPEAEQIFTVLVKKGSAQARAYLGLANIYWATSTYQHGKLLLDKAHDADRDDPEIRRRWLGTLTRKERIKQLQGYLEDEWDDDSEHREHLRTELVTLEESEEAARQGCRMASRTSELHLKMEPLMLDAKRIRGYGLRTEVNGARGTLLLDTGSSGLLINRKMAQKAGIKPIVKTDIHGLGDKGVTASYIGVADSIRVGELELQGCHVRVVDTNTVADGDGLIGSDIFDHFLVTINFPDKKFDLTPLPPMPPDSEAERAVAKKYPGTERFRDRYIAPEMKNYSSVYRFGHLLLIPTRINDSRPKLFLIDTGAFSDTISPEAAKEFTKVRGEDLIKVKGLNGAVSKVFTADNLTLSFSHFRQPARDMVAFDTDKISESAGTEISGMLGFAMLYQMTLKIDYRDGLVDFDYDPNHLH